MTYKDSYRELQVRIIIRLQLVSVVNVHKEGINYHVVYDKCLGCSLTCHVKSTVEQIYGCCRSARRREENKSVGNEE